MEKLKFLSHTLNLFSADGTALIDARKKRQREKCTVSSQENNVTQHSNSFARWISLFVCIRFAVSIAVSNAKTVVGEISSRAIFLFLFYFSFFFFFSFAQPFDTKECAAVFFFFFFCFSNNKTSRHLNQRKSQTQKSNEAFVSVFRWRCCRCRCRCRRTHLDKCRNTPTLRIIKWQYAHLMVIYWIDTNMQIVRFHLVLSPEIHPWEQWACSWVETFTVFLWLIEITSTSNDPIKCAHCIYAYAYAAYADATNTIEC